MVQSQAVGARLSPSIWCASPPPIPRERSRPTGRSRASPLLFILPPSSHPKTRLRRGNAGSLTRSPIPLPLKAPSSALIPAENMATGTGWQPPYNTSTSGTKYGASPTSSMFYDGSATLEYTQDLHLKMSKKIAQLTKVCWRECATSGRQRGVNTPPGTDEGASGRRQLSRCRLNSPLGAPAVSKVNSTPMGSVNSTPARLEAFRTPPDSTRTPVMA